MIQNRLLFRPQLAFKKKQGEIHNTQFQHLCNQQLSVGNGISQSIAAVLVAHFPSGRITEYDQGDPLDVPQTNYPQHALFSADSSGHQSFAMSDKAKGAPFTKDLAFSDWTGRLPAKPAFVLLSDGSLEARVQWDDHKSGQSSSAYFHFQKQ